MPDIIVFIVAMTSLVFCIVFGIIGGLVCSDDEYFKVIMISGIIMSITIPWLIISHMLLQYDSKIYKITNVHENNITKQIIVDDDNCVIDLTEKGIGFIDTPYVNYSTPRAFSCGMLMIMRQQEYKAEPIESLPNK